MVVVPVPAAVASPEEGTIVAAWTLLELHVTWLVTFFVAPEAVVPIARNWAVSFDGTD